ncbi:MAG: hypothetical protein RL277_2367 [Planctomycetota bacterium]|jgi:effector-binding domain-containing protein
MRTLPLLASLLALLPAACQNVGSSGSSSVSPSVRADIAITQPPYSEVHCSYKERLALAYACIEVRGNYALVGRRLAELSSALEQQGLRPAGPPFALFYDDPANTPIDELKSRLCLPIEPGVEVRPPLMQDLLPAATVAYARVAGPYPEVPRSYPGLWQYLGRMGWKANGPIREIYLVAPGSVRDWSELLTEIQVAVSGS